MMQSNPSTSWVYKFKFPNGEVTDGPQFKGRKNFFKVLAIQNLRLQGKRVLDLGCADGLFSFYMNIAGAEVVGIDILAERIRKANYAKEKLGMRNVDFRVIDFSHKPNVLGLGKFDVIFGFAVLHRSTDPFNLLADLGDMTETLVLEWKSPRSFFNKNLSVAFHETKGRLDPKNIDRFEVGTSSRPISDTSEAKPYLTMSKGFVINVLQELGFTHFESREVNDFSPRSIFYVAEFLYLAIFGRKPFSWRVFNRTILIARKNYQKGNEVILRGSPTIAEWDGSIHRFN